jgi:hypothetical protein
MKFWGQIILKFRKVLVEVATPFVTGKLMCMKLAGKSIVMAAATKAFKVVVTNTFALSEAMIEYLE